MINTRTITNNLASNSIGDPVDQYIITNQTGATLFVTEQAPAITRLWYVNNVSTGITASSYTPNFTDPGTYAIVCRSTFTCGTITSNAVNINVIPPSSITTGTVSGSPFCVRLTIPAAVSVPFTSVGTYNAGNSYTVQLSDPTGSFVSYTVIGTLNNTSNSGTISASIPANTPSGSFYRIRVVSSNPIITGTDNGAGITINLARNSVSPTSVQNIYTNTNGKTLSVTEYSVPTSRAWYYGTVSGKYTTNTGVTTPSYTPNFGVGGTYYVVCKSTFAFAVITTGPVQINVNDTTPPPPPDTICSTIKIQHDTVVLKTFSKIVKVPVYISVDSCTYSYFLWFKYNKKCSTYTHIQSYQDITEYYDSTVHQQTPPHDTTICTISMNEKSDRHNDIFILDKFRHQW